MHATPPISRVHPREGLFYRDRDVRDLIRTRPYEQVWGLLVDGDVGSALPGAEPFPLPVRTGDHRVDLQSALAQLAPVWGFRPLVDIDVRQVHEDLARASVMALSFLAQSARGADLPAVPQREVEAAGGIARRFVMRWRGEVDPDVALAVDACWVALAEHGLTASSRTARLVAGTGADAAACLSGAVAAASGPLGAGCGARSLALLADVERTGDPDAVVRAALTDGRLFGFGEADYEGEDPRVTGLRALAADLRVPRLDAALALSDAARSALEASDAVVRDTSGTHALYWAAVLLDHAGVPARMLTAMFACGRVAGWSAHIAEARADLG